VQVQNQETLTLGRKATSQAGGYRIELTVDRP
jgi:hypothetical protein